MQYLPYILIAVGGILILISFYLPDEQKKNESKEQTIRLGETVGAMMQGKQDLPELLQGKAEDIIDKADEQLSRISNEKIMSVSEYSDQVLEKINQNHQEVVFLYNMLNEKEEELKKMMTRMKVLSKEDTMGEQQMERLAERAAKVSTTARAETQIPPMTFTPERSYASREMPEASYVSMAGLSGSKPQEQVSLRNTMKMAKPPMDDEAQEAAEREMLRELFFEQPMPSQQQGSTAGRELGRFPADVAQAEEDSLQGRVLAMYRSGMSVLEISKSLHKGQGEVQLIVDLYGRKQ